MNPKEIMNVAWRSIRSNKMRTSLTMLGVIIGVAAVIVMVAVSNGTEAAIASQINGLGANLIFVTRNFSAGGPRPGQGGSRGGLVIEDAEAIADQIKGVEGFSVEQGTTQTIKANNTVFDDVSIVGTTPDFPEVRDMEVADGRFFNETELERASKIAVLGSSLATDLFGNDDPIGQSIIVGTIRLNVIGVMKERGLVSGVDFDSRLYAPLTLVNQRFLPVQMARIFGEAVGAIYVKAESQEVIEDVVLQTTLLLNKRHDIQTGATPDFVVSTQQDIIETQGSTTASFRTLLAWVAGVSLIVGGIGIMNIMLVSVTERTREIGIRQAVGATPNDIRFQFLTESVIISLIGGILGILFGVVGSWLFGRMGDMPTVVAPESIILAFFSAALVGIFFGYVPANKAAQLDPIVALRYE